MTEEQARVQAPQRFPEVPRTTWISVFWRRPRTALLFRPGVRFRDCRKRRNGVTFRFRRSGWGHDPSTIDRKRGSAPDGGPIRIEVKGRGLDLGRDSHLDWTLPDPSRSISGKHCEIRYRDGGYWLHDVSTNGTFVNGAALPARRAASLARRRPAEHRALHHRRFGRRGAKARSPAAAAGAALDAGRRRRLGAGRRGGSAGDRRHGVRRRRRATLRRTFSILLRSSRRRNAAGVLAGPAATEDDWLTAVSPRSAACAGSRARSGAAHTDAGAAGGRRAAARAAVAQASRRPTAPQAREVLDRIARAAGVPERVFSSRNPDELADEIGARAPDDGGEPGADAGIASGVEDADALVEPHDDPGGREQPPQVRELRRRRRSAIMFGPRDAKLSRRAGDDRAQLRAISKPIRSSPLARCRTRSTRCSRIWRPSGSTIPSSPSTALARSSSSRKAKLWDIYVERWRAKTKRADGRLLEAFIALFAAGVRQVAGQGQLSGSSLSGLQPSRWL